MLDSMLVTLLLLAPPSEASTDDASTNRVEAPLAPSAGGAAEQSTQGETETPGARPAGSPVAESPTSEQQPRVGETSPFGETTISPVSPAQPSSWDEGPAHTTPGTTVSPVGSPSVSSSPAPAATAVHRRGREHSDREIKFRIEALVDVGTQSIYRDPYRAFDQGNRTMFMFAVGGRADFALARGFVFLGAGAVYRQGSSRGTLVESTELLIREPVIFIRASFRVIEGLDLYLEPGGGPSIVDLEINGTTPAQQRAVIGMFNGYGGVTAYLPRVWMPRGKATRLTAGLDLGLGYVYRAPFEVEPTVSMEEDDIDIESTNFGDLPLDGLVWRGGLFIRFM